MTGNDLKKVYESIRDYIKENGRWYHASINRIINDINFNSIIKQIESIKEIFYEDYNNFYNNLKMVDIVLKSSESAPYEDILKFLIVPLYEIDNLLCYLPEDIITMPYETIVATGRIAVILEFPDQTYNPEKDKGDE
jgi:hypothetical protein